MPLRLGVGIRWLLRPNWRSKDAACNRFTFTPGFIAAAGYGGSVGTQQAFMSQSAIDAIESLVNPNLSTLIPMIPGVTDPVYDGTLATVYFDGATLPGQDGNPGSLKLELETQENNRIKFTFWAVDGVAKGFARVDLPLSAPKDTVVTIHDLVLTGEFAINGLEMTVENAAVSESKIEFSINNFPDAAGKPFKNQVRDGIVLGVNSAVGPLLTDILKGVGGSFSIPGVLGTAPTSVQYDLSNIATSTQGLTATISTDMQGASSGAGLERQTIPPARRRLRNRAGTSTRYSATTWPTRCSTASGQQAR